MRAEIRAAGVAAILFLALLFLVGFGYAAWQAGPHRSLLDWWLLRP